MDELLRILAELRPDVDFARETRLIDDGVLDSLDVLSLVMEIDEAFDVNVGAAHLTPENFNSTESIYALIQRLEQELE